MLNQSLTRPRRILPKHGRRSSNMGEIPDFENHSIPRSESPRDFREWKNLWSKYACFPVYIYIRLECFPSGKGKFDYR